MNIALEQAELVAKKAITEELGTEICQACGCNPKWSTQYQSVVANRDKLQRDLKATMAEYNWMEYQNEAVEAKKRREDHWLRTKVAKQRQALARMYMEVQHLKAELQRVKKGSEQCDTQTSSENLTPVEM